jgi:hypothetical protein
LSLHIKDYIPAPEQVREAVDDLLMYHQLRNQQGVRLYFEWRGKDRFKGTIGQMVAMDEMRELLDLSAGKPWEPLIKAIYLTKNYSTEVDLNGLEDLPPDQQTQVTAVIAKGMRAKKIVTEWLDPISKGDTLDAVYDAVQVKIGEGQHTQFQVLKLADMPSKPMPDGGVGLFDEILEIDNPEALAEYLKRRKQPLENQLILTFQRNKAYGFKQSIFMFLVWRNALYAIESSERRLNLNNPAGARRPDHYLERRFEHVWLPFDIIVDGEGKKEPSSHDITVRGQRVFKRGSLKQIFNEHPELSAWMQIFLLQVMDYLTETPDIPEGVTPNTVRMLENLSEQPIPDRIESASTGDASSYLVRIYGSSVTALAPQTNNLPAVIGTRKYVTDLIRYQHRKLTAETIEKALYDDWRQNSSRVIGDLKKLVRSRRLTDIVRTALANREYTVLACNDSTDLGNKTVKIREPTLTKATILSYSDHLPGWGTSSQPLEFVWTENEKLYTPGPRYTDEFKVKCQACKKSAWKRLMVLRFLDYRQICEFLGAKEQELPLEIVDHLHQQNTTPTGNSILTDVDPMDQIYDPWFRPHSQRRKYNFDERRNYTYDEWSHAPPQIRIVIPICNRCIRKFTPPNAEVHPHEGSYVTTITFGPAVSIPAPEG